jgi:hypothetical protein
VAARTYDDQAELRTEPFDKRRGSKLDGDQRRRVGPRDEDDCVDTSEPATCGFLSSRQPTQVEHEIPRRWLLHALQQMSNSRLVGISGHRLGTDEDVQSTRQPLQVLVDRRPTPFASK